MSSLVPVVETVVDEKVGRGEMFTAHDVTLEVRSRGHRAAHSDVRDAVHDYYNRGGMGVAYTRTNIVVPQGNPYLYHRSADNPSSYTNIRGGNAPVPSPAPATINVPQPQPASQDDDDDDDGLPGAIAIPPSLLSDMGGVTILPAVQPARPDGAGTAPRLQMPPPSTPVPTPVSQPLPNAVAGIAIAVQNGSLRVRTGKNKNKGRLVGRTVDGRKTLSIPSDLLRQLGFKSGQKVYAVASTGGVDITTSQPPSSAVFGKYTLDRNNQVRVTQGFLKRAGIGGNAYDVASVGNKVVVKLHK